MNWFTNKNQKSKNQKIIFFSKAVAAKDITFSCPCRRLVMGRYNLDIDWLVCFCGPGPPVLHLCGHAAWERPVVLQHQGKGHNSPAFCWVFFMMDVILRFCSVQLSVFLHSAVWAKGGSNVLQILPVWEWMSGSNYHVLLEPVTSWEAIWFVKIGKAHV